MTSSREDESIDEPADRQRRVMRSGVPALITSLLLVSWLLGAGTISEVSANLFDVAKIIAVVAFIAAMVALAMTMLGDGDLS
jgi:uncharacterized membrane protein YadS